MTLHDAQAKFTGMEVTGFFAPRNKKVRGKVIYIEEAIDDVLKNVRILVTIADGVVCYTCDAETVCVVKSNTELLVEAIGWQGGTIHQVSEYTGLKTYEITEMSREELPFTIGDETSAFGFGFTGCGTCSVYFLQKEIFPKYKGNVDFWQGVLVRMILKEKGV